MLRVRLLEVLESPLPVVFIEAVPGSGKQVLLDQWAKLPLGPSADIRLLIDGSRVSASGPAMLRLIWSRLRAELDIAELPTSDEDLLGAARTLLERARRPVSIALLWAEEIPAATFGYLLGMLEAQTEMRLIVSGAELDEHVQLARARGVSFSFLDDVAMALTLDETRALLNEEGMDLPPRLLPKCTGIPGGTWGRFGARWSSCQPVARGRR